jgi:hypothetical protein
MSRDLRIYRAVRTSAAMNFVQYLFFRAVHLTDPKLSLERGLHADTPSAGVQRAWDRYRESFGQIAELARQHELPVVFTAYPGEIELFSDNAVVERRWAELAHTDGVRFVNLMPSFKEERRAGLYLPSDGHPNRTGNTIVAREVAAMIERVLAARTGGGSSPDRPPPAPA